MDTSGRTLGALQTAETEASDLPRAVGRYTLLHELATGGMATVFLARGPDRADLVAVKVCHAHLRREPEFAAMFVDEARLASRIVHPNVVRTLDVSADDASTLFMAMEFVDGFSLVQLMRVLAAQDRPVPVPIALRIVLDALAGLHAAHELRDEKGIATQLVHRDVSPHNVLVGVDGISRIMDFGIAKAESRLSHTRDGTVKGKLGYMAPEQHGLGLPEGTPLPPVTRQADVYAAGIVLWELLTAQRLFHGESDAATLRMVLRTLPKKPSEANPRAPASLDPVVMRALARSALLRFRTAKEFASAIERAGVAPAEAATVRAFVQDALASEITARNAVVEALRDAPDASQRIDRMPAQRATTLAPPPGPTDAVPSKPPPPLPAGATTPRPPATRTADAKTSHASDPRPVSTEPPAVEFVIPDDGPDPIELRVVEGTDPSLGLVRVPSSMLLGRASNPPPARKRRTGRRDIVPIAIVGLLLAIAGGALAARLTHHARVSQPAVAMHASSPALDRTLHASRAAQPSPTVAMPAPIAMPAHPVVPPPVVASSPEPASPPAWPEPPPLLAAPHDARPGPASHGHALHPTRVPAAPRHTPYRPLFL